MKGGPIACAVCGAKLRSDRKKCLRCGAPVNGPGVLGATPQTLTRLLAAAGVVIVVGVAFLLLRGTSAPSGVATGPAPSSVPAPTAGARTPAVTPAAAEGSIGDVAASSVVLSANREATAAYTRGDISAAIDDLTKAVAADPQNAMVLNNLGQALVRAGRAQDALPYFDRAIVISDSTWAYHFNRARAYAELKQWGATIADYRDAAQLFPDDYATQFNLAKALEASGNLPDAITTYQRAIDLAPSQPDFRLAHGHALELAGRGRDAAAAYRAYLDLQPDARDADKIKARIAQLEGAPAAAGAQAQTPASAASTLAADRRVP